MSKDCSICSSMTLMESASLPTSEPSWPLGTRRERSPSAIAWVALSIPRRGLSDERMENSAVNAPTMTIAAPDNPMTQAIRATVASTGARGSAMIIVPIVVPRPSLRLKAIARHWVPNCVPSMVSKSAAFFEAKLPGSLGLP